MFLQPEPIQAASMAPSKTLLPPEFSMNDQTKSPGSNNPFKGKEFKNLPGFKIVMNEKDYLEQLAIEENKDEAEQWVDDEAEQKQKQKKQNAVKAKARNQRRANAAKAKEEPSEMVMEGVIHTEHAMADLTNTLH